MAGNRKLRLFRALFWLYGGIMLLVLFGLRLGQQAPMRWNLCPFDTVRRYLWVLCHSGDARQRFYACANLGGNVLLFVPLGVFLPLLAAPLRVWWKALLAVFAILVLVELAQLVTRLGSCDVDDLLLNFLGAALGWLLWRWGKNTVFREKGTHSASRT